MSSIADLMHSSEQLGAILERRRIRRVIDELAPLNLDEIVYRERVLEAIQPVTTSASPADAIGVRSQSDGGTSTGETAAAAAFNGAPSRASATG